METAFLGTLQVNAEFRRTHLLFDGGDHVTASRNQRRKVEVAADRQPRAARCRVTRVTEWNFPWA